MNTRFLSDEEVAQVQSIMAAYGLGEFSADVRLWGRGKAIQVRGSLDRLELSCLLAISRYLDEDRGGGSQAEAATQRPPRVPTPLQAERPRLALEFAVA